MSPVARQKGIEVEDLPDRNSRQWREMSETSRTVPGLMYAGATWPHKGCQSPGRLPQSRSDACKVKKMPIVRVFMLCLVALSPLFFVSTAAAGSAARDTSGYDPYAVAAAVDRMILLELAASDVEPATLSGDEDFLRRVTFDLTGSVPSPRQVMLFGLDPDRDKRRKMVDSLLDSDAYAGNWARYWRDVIYLRATNPRAVFSLQVFESWMTGQLSENRSWDAIAEDIVTATGDVRENGATALLFAHEGETSEIAGEVSRIFLGIQMQCANCHDHPTDKWKREQFHELAAFFPRVGIRPKRMDGKRRSFEVVSVNQERRRRRPVSEFFLRRLDKNQDGKLAKDEVQSTQLARNFDRLLRRADANKDQMLTIAELKNAQPPMNNRPGRGSAEHYMPDLDDPASRGAKIDPQFFPTGLRPATGLDDIARRETLADYLTSPRNKWFARAIVNRLWAELTGDGFYMPIDDMGPEREAAYPDVLDTLCHAFVQNDHDLKWLLRTITATDVYQRRIQAFDPSQDTPAFASATPTRLRADQIYDAVLGVLGIDERTIRPAGRGGPGAYRGLNSPRGAFNRLFGFDPSTPQEDITGNIPQALFMMNSQIVNGSTKADRQTRLGRLLQENADNDEAAIELYLLVLAREPSDRELEIFRDYIAEVGSRNEAFEDLMWSLLNSSEFLSRR